MLDAFYGSPHGAFIGQVPWVTSKEGYLLGLIHGIRSVKIPRYPKWISDRLRSVSKKLFEGQQ